MRHFSKYSVEDFNDLLSDENQVKESDTFSEVIDKIDADDLQHFYVSMNPDDVTQAIKDDPETVEILQPLHLIEVKGNSLVFYIATY